MSPNQSYVQNTHMNDSGHMIDHRLSALKMNHMSTCIVYPSFPCGCVFAFLFRWLVSIHTDVVEATPCAHSDLPFRCVLINAPDSHPVTLTCLCASICTRRIHMLQTFSKYHGIHADHRMYCAGTPRLWPLDASKRLWGCFKLLACILIGHACYSLCCVGTPWLWPQDASRCCGHFSRFWRQFSFS